MSDSPTSSDPQPRGHFQLAAGAVVLSLLPLLGWFFAPIHRPMDEGQLLVYPDLILRGYVPFRDFLMSYPPGNYFVLAGAYSLFGVELGVERTIGFGYRALLALSVLRLTWQRGAVVATLCAVGSAMLLTPLRLDAYSWIGGLALLVAATATLDREDLPARGVAAVFGGLLAGLALSFRVDLLLALALGAFPLLRGLGRSTALRVASGFAVGLLPLLIVTAIASPSAVWQTLVYETIFSTGPNRRIPVSELSPFLWLEFALVLLGVGAAILAASASRRNAPGIRSRTSRSALCAAGLCLGILPQALQRLDEDHLLYVACLATALLPASISRLWPERGNPRLAIATGALAISIAVAPFAGFSLQLLKSALSGARAPEFVRGTRSVRLRTHTEREDLASLAAQIEALTGPGDRLAVAPVDLRRTNYCDLSLYHLFPELEPASFHLEMLPGTTNREGSRFASDLESADIIVSSYRWEGWRQPDGSTWIGSAAPVAVRDAMFEEVGRHGHWLIHARKDRSRADVANELEAPAR